LKKLEGRRCIAALDLSEVSDITADVLLFPPTPEDKLWHILPFFWTPEGRVEEATKKDRIPYDSWVRDGFLHTTPGKVIRNEFVQAQLVTLRQKYQIVEIGFDPWAARELALALEEDGFKVTPIRQGYVSLSEPMKKVMNLALEHQFEHYGNPILKWMVKNVKATQDPAGNIKPDKEQSRRKIDGVVALIMALACAIGNPDATKESVYSTRGVILLDGTGGSDAVSVPESVTPARYSGEEFLRRAFDVPHGKQLVVRYPDGTEKTAPRNLLVTLIARGDVEFVRVAE
jgi:phage terminase large subunit-like protein